MKKKEKDIAEIHADKIWNFLMEEIKRRYDPIKKNESELALQCKLSKGQIKKYAKGQGNEQKRLLYVFKLIYGFEIPIGKLLSLINLSEYETNKLFLKLTFKIKYRLAHCSENELETLGKIISSYIEGLPKIDLPPQKKLKPVK